MGYEFRTEEIFECDRCGALLPGDLMVWLDNGEIYCEDCYDEVCAEEDDGEAREMYYDPENDPWLQSLPASLYDVADKPHSLFLSQLPPKQRDAFVKEFKAGRDPFQNEEMMVKARSLKARNFNAVSFTVSEDSPSIITGLGFVSVRNAEIKGMRKATFCPQDSFCKIWEEFVEEWNLGPVPFVSYNAETDRRCLKTTLKAYGVAEYDAPFLDVLAYSKKCFKTKLPDFHLKTVAAECKYKLPEHPEVIHNAEAIAVIALKTIPILDLL